MKKEFTSVFMINRMVGFEVSYFTLAKNKHPYYTLVSFKFTRNKKDFCEMGQMQEKHLTGFSKEFWEKWKKFQVLDLPEKEYNEIIEDMKKLIEIYPYHIIHYQEDDGTLRPFSFYSIKNLSMEVPYKFNRK